MPDLRPAHRTTIDTHGYDQLADDDGGHDEALWRRY